MKPHLRIHKSIKWGGAAVTVLLVVVWIGSGWRGAAWFSQSWAIAVDGGSIMVVYSPAALKGMTGWHAVPVAGEYRWWFFHHETPLGVVWGMPTWIPAGLVLLVTARAWWIDCRIRRLASVHLCPKCRYDRAGLATGSVCPECGAAPGGV
jgi:hypothetical protein